MDELKLRDLYDEFLSSVGPELRDHHSREYEDGYLDGVYAFASRLIESFPHE